MPYVPEVVSITRRSIKALGQLALSALAATCLLSSHAVAASDLIPQSITVPSTVVPGSNFTARWTLANTGSTAANAASRTVVRINQSSTSASPLVNLASISTPALAAKTSVSQSVTLRAPTSPGVYYVWVIADNFGAVTNQSNVSNDLQHSAGFTVQSAAPAAPTLSSPADGATITGTTVTLSWNSVSGAGAYSVGFRDLSTNALANISLATGTSITVSVVQGRSYRWDVASCISTSAGDNTSNCPNRSGNRTFSVQAATSSSAPKITSNPPNQATMVGKVVTFTASATGSPTPAVQWQASSNGGSTFTNVSGANSPSHSFAAQAAQDGHRFRAVFTNSAGSATTTAAVLTITSSPSSPAITAHPQNLTVQAGQTATFSAAAIGSPTPAVQWQVSTNNGSTFSNISSAISASYSFTAQSSQDGHRFRAVFTNSAGSATTNAAVLTVGRAVTAYYQPTPFPSSVTNGAHILDGWLPSVFYEKKIQKDGKLQIGGWSDTYRAYFYLNLEGLPPAVSEAALRLYAYSPGGNSTKVDFTVQSPNTSWLSAPGVLSTSMTWSTQPSSFTFVRSQSAGSYDSWWEIPITSLYNGWKNGSSNNGLALFPSATNNNFDAWRSSRYANDGQRPTLKLTFVPPITVPNFRMPLPRNVRWLVTTEVGGWDCRGVAQDQYHTGNNYFSVDFNWRNKDANDNPVYANPNDGGQIPILAAADGVVKDVISSDRDARWRDNGYFVAISHDPAQDLNVKFSTRYLHMKSAPLVGLNAKVTQGQPLGYMGSTGISTGPHLHFGIRYDGNGSSTSNVRYALVSGWLMKSFQTECLNGSWNRYYLSQ